MARDGTGSAAQVSQMTLRPKPGRSAIAALLAGVGSFALYLATLAPTVLADDSAELVSTAHVLGICHPTGYPIWLLLAKLFDLVPIATPPVRIGVFSALCGSAAAATIAWITSELTASLPAALLGGLVAACSGPLWSSATEAEVHAMNALVISLSLLFFVRFERTRRPPDFIALAATAGLGLAHHRIAIFYTAPLVAAGALMLRPRPSVLLKATGALAAPLLFYLYLPIRAATHPAVMFSDISKWSELRAYLMGASYADLAFARPFGEAIAVARRFLADTVTELTVGGSALAAIGALALIRRQRAPGACLVLSSTLLLAWNLGYMVPDWEAYFVPIGLAIAVWVGVGLASLANAMRSSVARRHQWAAPAVTFATLALVVANLVQHNWSSSGHRGDWQYYDKASAVLAQIPHGGILVSDLDYGTFLPMYLQIVEGKRRDIVVTGASDIYPTWEHDREVTPAIERLQEGWRSPASGSDEARSENALEFAIALSDTLHGARSVYAWIYRMYPPLGLPVESPWADLVRVGRDPQPKAAEDRRGESLAYYGNGVSLASVSLEPPAVRPRDRVRFVLEWRCSQELARPPAVLLTLAREDASGEPKQPGHMLTKYATWLCEGASPIPATPRRSVYRQEITGIVPTNAPAGRWRVRVGVSDELYGPINAPMTVKDAAQFEVLPASGYAGP